MGVYQIFFTGYAVGCLTTILINIGYHKMTFNKGRSKRESSDQIVQNLDDDLSEPISIKEKLTLENEKEKTISPVVKKLIYKIRGGKKTNDEFCKSEFGNNQWDVDDISLDGSKPHNAFFLQKKTSLKIVAGVILSSCLFVSLFFIFSKTVPENYLDRFKEQQPQPIVSNVPNVEENKKIPYIPPTPQNPKNLDPQLPQLNPTNERTWYIIELQNGENIITQNASETDGIISVLGSDGRERKFRRNDVKGVKKTKL